MKFTPEIEAKIVAQLRAEPDRALILPEWAYRGQDQPVIYRDGQRERLVRYLYEQLVEPLPHKAGLALQPGWPARDVNPRHWVATPTRRTRLVCPNGHRYTAADMTAAGHRCQQCQEDQRLGTPGAADLNRAKTHCPKNHLLVKRPNGKRRCLECPRAQQAAYRARQEERK